MQRKTLKQKCLAWLLSLAVAVTFIPLTAGFAFADTDVTVDLQYANTGSNVPDIGKMLYVNFATPWQTNNTINYSLPETGSDMKAAVENIKLTGGVGSSTTGYTVSSPQDEWVEPGEYSLTVTGKPGEIFKTGSDGTNYYLTGTYTVNFTIAALGDLAGATVTLEYDSVDFDGKMHKPKVIKVVDGEGVDITNTEEKQYYEVSYPNESANAYIKVGEMPVKITALEDSGYTGSKTVYFNIKDFVTDITVYSMNGRNGNKKQKKVFKYGSWGNYALSKTLNLGYKEKTFTSSSYIPLETLLEESGVGTKGQFNDKDLVVLYSNSDPQLYTNDYLPNGTDYIFGDLKEYGYTTDGKKILQEFGDESKVPAFLILDSDNKSDNPMMAVGHNVNQDYLGGYFFCKPLSEIVFKSMNIAGLSAKAADVTYTGKVVTPKVSVKDGKTVVPIIIKATAKKVGPATAKVTAKASSDYYGTKTVKYSVLPKGTTIKSAKGSKKSFTVKWKKQKTQTTGYQIRYSKKSNFSDAKIKTISKTGTTEFTVKKLKKKTKYYVQIRTYKKVNGKKYCSAWSKKTTVKTK